MITLLQSNKKHGVRQDGGSHLRFSVHILDLVQEERITSVKVSEQEQSVFEGEDHCGCRMVDKEDNARRWEQEDQQGSDEVGYLEPPVRGLGLM